MSTHDIRITSCTSLVNNGARINLDQYPANDSSGSPRPAELGQVGASEAKFREGGFGSQANHSNSFGNLGVRQVLAIPSH